MIRSRSPALASVIVALLLVAGLLSVTAAETYGATTPCRVRNVTQDTVGSSLIAMVEAAVDHDRLWVRGTCSGPLVIRADVVIAGKGEVAVLTGRDRARVVRISRRATVTLRDLEIVRGRARYDPDAGLFGRGGDVLNRGQLTLIDSTISDGTGYFGGGIRNEGLLTLTRSTVSGNTAVFEGAGISNGGRLTLTDSTVSGNRTSFLGKGGGIWNGGKRLAVIRSDVAGNTAGDADGGEGGGLYIDWGKATLLDSRVADNVAGSSGGGITNYAGNLTLTDSAVRRNRAKGGGGIRNVGGRITLVDSAVTGNEATEHGGGGITNQAVLALTGSTVSGNTAANEGGGIWNFEGGVGPRGPIAPGTVTLDATSGVTDNKPDDCSGTPAC